MANDFKISEQAKMAWTVIQALIGIILSVVSAMTWSSLQKVDDHDKRITVLETDSKHSTADFQDLKRDVREVSVKLDLLREELRKKP